MSKIEQFKYDNTLPNAVIFAFVGNGIFMSVDTRADMPLIKVTLSTDAHHFFPLSISSTLFHQN